MSHADNEFRFSFGVSFQAGSLDESRLRLLQEIGRSGTLTAAAEALQISYKTAWSWLEAMNNAANQPLVESVQGGSHGGRTKLTASGEALLKSYQSLRSRHEQFMHSLDAERSDVDNVQDFISRMSLHTSARNQLHGSIARIWGDATQAWVDVMIDELAMVTARVAQSSVQDMGLQIGQEVITLTKATCLSLHNPEVTPPLKRGPTNRIAGKVKRISEDDGNVQIVLDIAANRSLTALVPVSTWNTLQAAAGSALVAWFDPDHVILVKLH